MPWHDALQRARFRGTPAMVSLLLDWECIQTRRSVHVSVVVVPLYPVGGLEVGVSSTVPRLTLVPLTDTPCGDIVTEPAEGCLPQHLQLLLLIH
jgi:hypothetical protein